MWAEAAGPGAGAGAAPLAAVGDADGAPLERLLAAARRVPHPRAASPSPCAGPSTLIVQHPTRAAAGPLLISITEGEGMVGSRTLAVSQQLPDSMQGSQEWWAPAARPRASWRALGSSMLRQPQPPPPRAPHALALRRSMASFEVLKELYRGRSSAVFYASHCASGTPVALKLYKKRRLSTLNRCGQAMAAAIL
jgi:hypothetical protein